MCYVPAASTFTHIVISDNSIVLALTKAGKVWYKMSRLWRYCTKEQCRDLLLSFQLFGETNWSFEKQIACLYTVSNHIEAHYHYIIIPKKDGSKRQLDIPDYILKKIQKNILHHIIEKFSVPECATAYQKGKGILNNVTPHIGKKTVLKLDIKDFFHSIIFPMVYARAFPEEYFPPSIRTLLTYLCCYRDRLPQGAPSSAAISNLVLKPFDTYMELWCKDRNIQYTRYCDDMTFSGNFHKKEVMKKVQHFLHLSGFSLNYKKTKELSSNRRQQVTGIVVNSKPQVSKEYRRRVSQEIYYCQKFGVLSHLKYIDDKEHLPLGQIGVRKYVYSLQGKVQYILYINPEDKLFRKLLDESIEKIWDSL